MASFLDRYLDLTDTSTNYFTDDEGNIHEQAINNIKEAGITSGCGGTNYCPSGQVTRGQMATFLNRPLNIPNTPNDYFTDDEGIGPRAGHQQPSLDRPSDHLRLRRDQLLSERARHPWTDGRLPVPGPQLPLRHQPPNTAWFAA